MILVTGCSGAGKSVVLRSLEDKGFFCIDNLPIEMIEPFINLSRSSAHVKSGIAFVVDIRGKDFTSLTANDLSRIKSRFPIEVWFIDASDRVIIQRFNETRRQHPLMIKSPMKLREAVTLERELLSVIQQFSDHRIDTSHLSVHELKDIVNHMVTLGKPGKPIIHLLSFGYKYGIPYDIELLFFFDFYPIHFLFRNLSIWTD